MSETFYVLMATGWDYNDEYFFRVDGGNPVNVFLDKEKAKLAAQEKSLAEFKSLFKENMIREYSSDGLQGLLNDSVSEEDLLFEEGIFMTLFGVTAEEWYESLWEEEITFKVQPTEDQWKKLMSCFNIQSYEVVEVQKG